MFLNFILLIAINQNFKKSDANKKRNEFTTKRKNNTLF